MLSAVLMGPLLTIATGAPSLAEFPLIRYELDADQRAALPPGFSFSFGGEIRERYEYTHNPVFGADPQDPDGVWLQRLAAHSDLRWGRHARVFVELHSAIEEGRAAFPAPLDEDELEFQNLFGELWFAHDGESDLVFRLGRQEMQLGSARLVAVRDGPNVRYTYDGGRILVRSGSSSLSALAVRPRKNQPGAFDDSTDDAKALWGFYATKRDGWLGTNLDLYYLGYHNDMGAFDQGTREEQRHTLGTRVFGSNGNWSWNWEPMVQFGTFGNSDLLAWTVASETAYHWANARWKPTVKLNLDIASGDRDPQNPDLETFNPLFPRGNYFSQDATLGPLNFYDAHLFVIVRPNYTWEVTADFLSFWRLSTRDGVYRPTGRLMRSGVGSDARFVASSVALGGECTINRHWSCTIIYTHLRPETFLKETGPSENVDFFELTARFRF